jgi:hypothetical protein
MFARLRVDYRRNHEIIDFSFPIPADPIERLGNPTKLQRLLDWQQTVVKTDVSWMLYRETSSSH